MPVDDLKDLSSFDSETIPVEVAGVIHRNIKTMLNLRRQAEKKKGPAFLFANAITRKIGSVSFVLVQGLVVIVWLLVNLDIFGWQPLFDPYPFTLLSTVLTVEAIFVAIFILMNQNHMADLAQSREELDIQISLLTEHEVTQVMTQVERIAMHLKILGKNNDLTDLKEETSPEKVLRVIEQEIVKFENSPSSGNSLEDSV